MRTLLVIFSCFLVIIQQENYKVFCGPIAGAACCTACCATELLIPLLGWTKCSVCEPMCLASHGTLPPCEMCAAAFLSPTR